MHRKQGLPQGLLARKLHVLVKLLYRPTPAIFQSSFLAMFHGTLPSFMQVYRLGKWADCMQIDFYRLPQTTHLIIVGKVVELTEAHGYCTVPFEICACCFQISKAMPISKYFNTRRRVHTLSHRATGTLAHLTSCKDSTAQLCFRFTLFLIIKNFRTCWAFLLPGAWQGCLIAKPWHGKKIARVGL